MTMLNQLKSGDMARIVAFENESELLDIADYYLNHDNERKRIGENAARLTRERHTYAHRLKNIFDIVYY